MTNTNERAVWGSEENEEAMDLRHTVSIDQIKKLPSCVKVGGWTHLSNGKQKELLWELGFNTQIYGVYLGRGPHRSFGGNKQVDGAYIYGQERTDQGWTDLVLNGRNVASEESRFYFDKGELARISGSGSVWAATEKAAKNGTLREVVLEDSP